MKWLISDYHRLEKRLKKLLWRGGQSREEAEDLIQEALLRLHEYYRRGEVKDRDAFLVRTVRNLSIDKHRRAHRHLYAQESIEELEASVPLFDPQPASDEIFEAQQRLNKIRATLDAVSLRTREIYFAHRAGYSYAEIEARLGISKSTIEKHIARAVLALMDVRDSE